ncbi:MAG: helix-turn-helix transcriptional regulator [Clostridia bacterium]|nr:helix-turn-helix transcriptional regulator [Clostridia bacterium]
MAYRKSMGLTQAELAERINYSDKSVSKWESGGGAPDIYVLVQLAEIFEITVNELVAEDVPKKTGVRRNIGLHALIMGLSSGIVWLVATCVFVLLSMLNVQGAIWTTFIFALPVNAIVLIVLSAVWKYKLLQFISVSATIWTVLLSVFCVLWFIFKLGGSVWLVFLLGAPLQVLEVLWAFFRYSVFRKRGKKQAEVK